MKTPSNDGGMAFPTWFPEEHYGTGYRGMTLRDYFAGQALVGDLASQSVEVGIYGTNSGGWQKHAAENAYILADAMLAARKEGSK
jgi:hypothetical protein